MPVLNLSYTDPRTGAVYPDAVLEISNVKLQLNPAYVEMEVAIFVNAAARDSGRQPLEHRPSVILTQPEIATIQAQFALAAYTILAQRPEFAGAVIGA